MKATSAEHFTLDRPTPVLSDKELESLRVRTWFFAIANRAIGNEVDNFNKVLWEQVMLDSDQETPNLGGLLRKWLNKDAQLARMSEASLDFATNIRSAGYHSGKSSPSSNTLSLFEEVLPGSRAEYDYGPQGEPLWAVLAGKINVCEDYVEQCLPPQMGEVELGFNDRFQRVLDALVAPCYQIDFERIPDLGLSQQSAHPVWLSFVNERLRLPNDDLNSPELLSATTIDDQMLCAIALWRIALDRKEGPALRLEWLLVGLCQGVVAYHWTEEIQAYLLKLLREQGAKLDEIAKNRGVQIMSFEDRWTTEFVARAPKKLDAVPQVKK